MDTNTLFKSLRKDSCYCAYLFAYLSQSFPLSACSGGVHSEVSVQLSRGHVISERLHHKTTGSSHSTSATLMTERSL